jgi:hypothetical protein
MELNKEGCHADCEGCLKPLDRLYCIRCKQGLRLVEGECLAKTTSCPSHMKENALGECQSCDLNNVDRTTCYSCLLSFNNECDTCGPFSNTAVFAD